MRLFGPLYARALTWARHPRAVYFLCGLSFVEAFIFPIMPEVMLAPMMLGKRHKAFFYANISLLFSLLGSLVGYALGHWAFHALSPLLDSLHLLAPIDKGVDNLRMQMNQHWLGLMVVLALAALQPVVPMKFVTWAAGIVGVPIVPFLVCMAIGRGKRVWLLALLIRIFGERAERILHKHIERIGWAALIILAALAVWWFLSR
ncbi:membrane protein YqaA, SNARE-associated domain [Dyella jiangningensis]|uniref:YqaA family protein n=1 Tax=Dyella sp. AtDHG13 TaxID=1938897 RepID=UPI0008826E8D|nr:VTT domain-containing protein [Dyella sp. AtDHG13]PXV61465.1 membrane protein YqaA with SNARE-associated domain [Dyella sp. AtDHG13]SDJ88734.1 membrane protein YqaA, SNARE-associated domain [Dyella jiangningensis]